MRVIGLAILFFLGACQQEKPQEKIGEIPLGYRGRARVNPYLAAETYLREKGWLVESTRTWSEGGKETSLIFMPASFLQSSGMVRRALDWVAEGRTLIVTIQGGEPERNDFTDRTSGSLPEKGEGSGMDELLEVLAIERVTLAAPAPNQEMMAAGALARPWELARIREDFGGHALEFEGEVGLKVTKGWDWMPPQRAASRMVGVPYGDGVVLVLAHARPLRNPYLARADHAEFLEFLAQHYGGDRIVFLYGSSTSFFALIWREGKMAVIGGLLVLGAWLWMRIPRFGPVLRDQEVQRRPYGEALTTSARFLWRTGELNALFTPLRQRAREGRAVDPEATGDAPTSKIPPDRRIEGEELPNKLPKDPGLILKVIQRLQQQLK